MSAFAVPPPAELDLLSSDVEDSLRETVRALLASRCTPDLVVRAYDGDDTLGPALWRALAVDLGLAGLLVPEEYGGAGATARAAAIVLGEMGRAIAPVPFLTSAVVATTAALPTSDHELLGGLAAGELTAALLVPLSEGADTFTARVERRSDGLSGRVPVVAGALDADVLLVPVAAPGGTELHLVERAGTGVVTDAVVSLDMTRPVADVALEDAPSRLLLEAGAGEQAVRGGLRLGAALLASEQVGIAEWCLRDTVDYLKERRQFGRVLASYQALKHRLADLSMRVQSAGAAAQYAAAVAAVDHPDLLVATSVAQAYCSTVAVEAAEECVQLHGGIGMTWEHPAHLYLKRAKADQLALGSTGDHLDRLAELVGLPVGRD